MQINPKLVDITCPGCGLLCDDISINNNTKNSEIVIKNACSKGVVFFTQKITNNMPNIAGKPVELQQAIEKAASLLNAAEKPLFAGLSTDLTGFRSTFKAAQKAKAPIMHMNAQSTWRNTKVLQTTGWQTTTLMEVKNRADVILCIGTDIVKHNPRFFERNVWVDHAMFVEPNKRDIIYLGGENLEIEYGVSPKGKKPTVLPCASVALPEVVAVLRALIQGKTLLTKEVAGISMNDLNEVVSRLKAAKYAVLTWVAKDFDFPHAELTIQNITQSVVSLNENSRAMALALGGSDGDTTVNYAHTWLSALMPGEHNLKQHDAIVWVNSFSPDKLTPKTDCPVVAIGNSNMHFETPPAVFIPVATPALDTSGTLFRVDSSIVLPLKQTKESQLPTLAQVMSRMEALLT